jgi:hypothetical protein
VRSIFIKASHGAFLFLKFDELQGLHIKKDFYALIKWFPNTGLNHSLLPPNPVSTFILLILIPSKPMPTSCIIFGVVQSQTSVL